MNCQQHGARRRVADLLDAFGVWALWIAAGCAGLSPACHLFGQQGALRFSRVSHEQGLSQVQVNCLLQDRRGFLWFGTKDGLNRYDGYEMRLYKANPADPETLTDSQILSLAEDPDGVIWVGTINGLNAYDPTVDRFQRFPHEPDNPQSPSGNHIGALLSDKRGKLWIGAPGGVDRLDLATRRFERMLGESERIQPICFFEDSRGAIWIGTAKGLIVYPAADRATVRLSHNPQEPDSLTPGRVSAIAEDGSGRLWVGAGRTLNVLDLDEFHREGRARFQRYSAPDGADLPMLGNIRALHVHEGALWIGTDREGLYKLDLASGDLRNWRHDSTDRKSLGYDTVRAIAEDRGGLLWFATGGDGLSVYNPRRPFEYWGHRPGVDDSLPDPRIYAVFQDSDGDLWVGSDGGGVAGFDRNGKRLAHFLGADGESESPDIPSVQALAEDDNGVLWVGTGKGLRSLALKEAKSRGDAAALRRFSSEDPVLNELGQRAVTELRFLEGQQRLWIGASGMGLVSLDPDSGRGTVRRHDPERPESLGPGLVRSVLPVVEGVEDLVWVGLEGGGLDLFHPGEKRFEHFRHDQDNPNSLSHDSVIALCRGEDGLLWIGARGGGLNAFDRDSGVFRRYREADGLPNDTVYGILADRRGRLWLSHNRGLARFDPQTERFTRYTVDDGLQGAEFNTGASFKTLEGKLFFGGMNGLTGFWPDEIRDNLQPPPAALTGFLLNHRPVPVQPDAPESPLTAAIESQPPIAIDHRQDAVSFRFAALDFANPRENRYAYKLEGFDPSWIQVDASNRLAVYTNLAPGSYVFRVKAANPDDVWGDATVSLPLRIEPPIWLTWPAFALYAALLVSLIWIVRRFQRRELARQQAVVESLRRLDDLKNEFLANTSHELRTPLNGIIGLTESLLDGSGGALSERVRADLAMTLASAKRLSGLVSDILDFAKMKKTELILGRRALDLRALVDTAIAVCKPLIGPKNLELVNHIDRNFPRVHADEARLQQILQNLIGNAVKFTQSGVIEISAEKDVAWAMVRVVDTGIGIPGDKIESIFESFEQAHGAESRAFGGAGLGLSLVRQLVKLHGGRIWAASEVGKGSTFAFTLPLAADNAEEDSGSLNQGVAAYAMAAKSMPAADAADHLRIGGELEPSRRAGAPHILAVDDDRVNCKVLFNMLRLAGYAVTTETNPLKAVALIERGDRFDLVILDIMMPHISGYDVCRRIRDIKAAWELPVLFLTAKNQPEDLTMGFESGANDFLVKPVSKPELLARVKIHLTLAEMTRRLEGMVRERTVALDARCRELETLNEVVKAVNEEMEFKKVFDVLTAQAARLFPQTEKTLFYFQDADREAFHCVAGIGNDGLPDGQPLSLDQLARRYCAEPEQLAQDVFAAQIQAEQWFDASDSGSGPKSLLGMTVRLESRLVGLLLLINESLEDAFGEAQAEAMRGFREHAVAAALRAKTLKDVVDAQKALVGAAHKSGMAEIAAHVLHNMGNALNSIQVSAQIIHETASRRRERELLERVVGLIQTQREALGPFFTQDKRGKIALNTLEKIAYSWRSQSEKLQKECDQLQDELLSMTGFLREHQRYAFDQAMVEETDLNQLVQETLELDAYLLKEQNISVHREFQPLPALELEKSKFRLTLLCLMENACEAIRDAEEAGRGQIVLRTRSVENGVVLELADNGVGIAQEYLDKVFLQGFTTKPEGRGMGLHYAANAMSEVSGSIKVVSEGPGKGASVRLFFPLRKTA